MGKVLVNIAISDNPLDKLFGGKKVSARLESSAGRTYVVIEEAEADKKASVEEAAEIIRALLDGQPNYIHWEPAAKRAKAFLETIETTTANPEQPMSPEEQMNDPHR